MSVLSKPLSLSTPWGHDGGTVDGIEVRAIVASDLEGSVWGRKDLAWLQECWPRMQLGDVALFGAFADRRGVANVGVDYRQRPSAAVLWHLGVQQEMQGNGIGSRLVTAAEDAARDAGFDVMMLASYIDNARATALYERLGYVIVGSEREDWNEHRDDGTILHHDEPCWTMTKQI